MLLVIFISSFQKEALYALNFENWFEFIGVMQSNLYQLLESSLNVLGPLYFFDVGPFRKPNEFIKRKIRVYYKMIHMCYDFKSLIHYVFYWVYMGGSSPQSFDQTKKCLL